MGTAKSPWLLTDSRVGLSAGNEGPQEAGEEWPQKLSDQYCIFSFPVLNSQTLNTVFKTQSAKCVFILHCLPIPHPPKKRHFCYLTSPELHPFTAAAAAF